jgi:hypothetical protein
MFNFNKKQISMQMIHNAKSVNITHTKKSPPVIKKKIMNKKLILGGDNFGNNKYSYDNITHMSRYMKENKNKKYAFVICGVGDFICIDYFLNFKDIHFIFVSKSSLLLKTLLMKTEKNDKSHLQHFAVYFNFDILNRPGFNDVNEMFERLPYLKLLNKISQINVVDIKLFNHIRQNIIKCNPKIEALNKNNRFLKKKHCNIEKFNLPKNIMLVCPYTQDNRVDCILCDKLHIETYNCKATRNFTTIDYYNTESILKKNKMIGVIVTDVESILPEEIKDSFINLSGKTSIEESIEILKASHGYIGIDSFLSIVASKIFTSNDVIIKSNNKHAYNWEKVYWYPLTSTLNSIIF